MDDVNLLTHAAGSRIALDDVHEMFVVLGVPMPVPAPSYRHTRDSTAHYEEDAFDGVAYQLVAHISSSVDEYLVRVTKLTSPVSP